MVWQESEGASEEGEEAGDEEGERGEGEEARDEEGGRGEEKKWGMGELEEVERAGGGENGEAELEIIWMSDAGGISGFVLFWLVWLVWGVWEVFWFCLAIGYFKYAYRARLPKVRRLNSCASQLGA